MNPPTGKLRRRDARSGPSRGSKDAVVVSYPPFPFIWTTLTHFNRPQLLVPILVMVAPSEASPLTRFPLMTVSNLDDTARFRISLRAYATFILAHDVARFSYLPLTLRSPSDTGI